MSDSFFFVFEQLGCLIQIPLRFRFGLVVLLAYYDKSLLSN